MVPQRSCLLGSLGGRFASHSHSPTSPRHGRPLHHTADSRRSLLPRRSCASTAGKLVLHGKRSALLPCPILASTLGNQALLSTGGNTPPRSPLLHPTASGSCFPPLQQQASSHRRSFAGAQHAHQCGARPRHAGYLGCSHQPRAPPSRSDAASTGPPPCFPAGNGPPTHTAGRCRKPPHRQARSGSRTFRRHYPWNIKQTSLGKRGKVTAVHTQ